MCTFSKWIPVPTDHAKVIRTSSFFITTTTTAVPTTTSTEHIPGSCTTRSSGSTHTCGKLPKVIQHKAYKICYAFNPRVGNPQLAMVSENIKNIPILWEKCCCWYVWHKRMQNIDTLHDCKHFLSTSLRHICNICSVWWHAGCYRHVQMTLCSKKVPSPGLNCCLKHCI